MMNENSPKCIGKGKTDKITIIRYLMNRMNDYIYYFRGLLVYGNHSFHSFSISGGRESSKTVFIIIHSDSLKDLKHSVTKKEL